MPDDSMPGQLDVTPKPPPDPEIHGAESRPGFRDPIGAGTVVDRAEISRPIPDGAVEEIEFIEGCVAKWREPQTDPRYVPALKRLRSMVPVLARSSDPDALGLLRRANDVLPRSWRHGHDDTARLDALIRYLNNGMRGQPWTRDAVDRLMEGGTS